MNKILVFGALFFCLAFELNLFASHQEMNLLDPDAHGNSQLAHSSRDLSSCAHSCPECLGRTIGCMRAPGFHYGEATCFTIPVTLVLDIMGACFLHLHPCGAPCLLASGSLFCMPPCLTCAGYTCHLGADLINKAEVIEYSNLAVQCDPSDACAPNYYWTPIKNILQEGLQACGMTVDNLCTITQESFSEESTCCCGETVQR